jgi:hypothetical protein
MAGIGGFDQLSLSKRGPDERSDIRVEGCSAIAIPHIALMSFVKWFEREISSPCDFRWSAR